MTDIVLYQLYHYFRHPFTKKLYKVLKYTNYKIDKKMIDNLIKYYIYYQKHAKSLGHFKFTLKENRRLWRLGKLTMIITLLIL